LQAHIFDDRTRLKNYLQKEKSLAVFLRLLVSQGNRGKSMGGGNDTNAARGNRKIVAQEIACVSIRTNSSITNAWANAISTQDHLIRKMNEKSMIEIPVKKVIYWQKKFYEALVQIDALSEAAAQDLGLENIYKRSALIEAVKANLEAQAAAETQKRSRTAGAGEDERF
jgi:hypothetical protein